jgi:hypothetical protein
MVIMKASFLHALLSFTALLMLVSPRHADAGTVRNFLDRLRGRLYGRSDAYSAASFDGGRSNGPATSVSPTLPEPERIGPPKAPPAPALGPVSGAVNVPIIPATNPEIESRLQDWQKANAPIGPSPSGQQVEIKVDGKPVILEIRVVPCQTPVGPGPLLQNPIAKAFQADAGLASDKEKGRLNIVGTYRTVSDTVLDPQVFKTGQKVLDSLDQALSKEAKALTMTQAAIRETLDQKLPSSDRPMPLTSTSRMAYQKALRGIADALDATR